ncbi:hypothetical protein U472_03420 [Orenia metallireducens]|uniref:Nucleotide pyrophosphatase n=1 Tax=Orenia metallireducens TaxID=1413210 RepID=A0A1C0AB98_9FIRM|nr:alkaline phosphatase family protein [Orenia metallireducens]OCL27614.1 hypothetical protein U472_03420 [Orenia metallireducens]
MKLLIVGVDGMPPEILFGNLSEFPNMKKLCMSGAYGDYDAYTYGYGSRDNWLSLYTGLTPQQHGVIGNTYSDTKRKPRREDYEDKSPFWDKLNEKDISVGMWNGLVTTPSKNIKGYMISGEPNFEIDGAEDPLADVNPVFCEEDKDLKKYIIGEIDRPPMPKSPEEFGYTWEEILEDYSLADKILKDDYFIECVDYLEGELEFYKNNIINMQKNNPVDILFFYTAIVDFIAHFQMHDQTDEVMKKSLKLIDQFIGEVLDELAPEKIIVMSDHGLKSLASFFPNTSIEIQKEAFGWKDKSVWLKNGQIATRARNQAFLTGIHSLKGSFIIAGEGIKKDKIGEMRTVDFYPTLLEIFDIEIPKDRQGFVLDIFSNKEIINKDKLLTKDKIKRENIAIIQNIEVPEFNRVINEVFLDNRFANITVFSEEKYKNIFLDNPRVEEVKLMKDFKLNFKEFQDYDKLFIAYRNKTTGEFKYLELKNDLKY